MIIINHSLQMDLLLLMKDIIHKNLTKYGMNIMSVCLFDLVVMMAQIYFNDYLCVKENQVHYMSNIFWKRMSYIEWLKND